MGVSILILRGGESILDNGGTYQNPNLFIHQSHFNILGQFLLSNNPSESKNGGTRIYQTISPNPASGLEVVKNQ